jgi:hypothetical protein
VTLVDYTSASLARGYGFDPPQVNLSDMVIFRLLCMGVPRQLNSFQN